MVATTAGLAHPAPEGRDLGEWSRLEDQDRDQEAQEHDQRRRWKGKGKDLGYNGIDEEMGVSQVGMPSLDEERDNDGVNGSYPPVSEEAAEEREVAEVRNFSSPVLFCRAHRVLNYMVCSQNLKRWEVAERLRRKAVRDSRASSAASVPSPVVTLGRRASQLIFRRSSSSSRNSASILRVHSPTPLDDVEQQRSSRQLMRTDTADTTSNPFKDPAASASDAALMSPTSADPFRPGAKAKEHTRGDSVSTVTGAEPVQPTPQRPILQAMGSSTFFTEEPQEGRIPRPRSLDLPTTPAPQHAYEGGGRVPARMSGPPAGMRVRKTAVQLQEEEEEMERERREGRWWTDWLCGLKERGDPSGQVSCV